ncbi:MAG: hypothetical protein JJ831_08185 [Prochlorococcus marinus XMU1422]|nr:hypothetical protein [Prochlorococcus marinus XMU1421]MBO7013279.1 hypothetical protein [Prochlorococcus marinus XMU1422]MCR8542266.1 hypothetical protein [Prochlorococcus marinus XMU1423]
MWDPKQELKVLNSIKKINEEMQKFGVNFKEAFEMIYANNKCKININCNKLIVFFKVHKIINSSWEENYTYFLNNIFPLMGLSNEPKLGRAILVRLVNNKNMDKVLKKFNSSSTA